MRPTPAVFLAALVALTALPVAAFEVTHSYGTRFGVSYASNPAPGQDRTRPLGEAWVALGVRHRTDNGLTFAFEMEVVAGNLPQHGAPRPVPARLSLGLGDE